MNLYLLSKLQKAMKNDHVSTLNLWQYNDKFCLNAYKMKPEFWELSGNLEHFQVLTAVNSKTS